MGDDGTPHRERQAGAAVSAHRHGVHAGFCADGRLWLRQGIAPSEVLRLPWRVWALGVCGLFGFHFFYFTALQNAPVIEASLIAYLWPLLIVLFSALLPRGAGGGKLRRHHMVGAALGLAGAALIATRGQSLAIDARFATGYLAACACALTWSSYSVLSRLAARVPSRAVGSFCGANAALAWLCHLAWEITAWPAGLGAWLAVAGLGPVGLAFFTWDIGMKHGDIRALGAAAYGAPLLSTLLLIAAGLAPRALVDPRRQPLDRRRRRAGGARSSGRHEVAVWLTPR